MVSDGEVDAGASPVAPQPATPQVETAAKAFCYRPMELFVPFVARDGLFSLSRSGDGDRGRSVVCDGGAMEGPSAKSTSRKSSKAKRAAKRTPPEGNRAPRKRSAASKKRMRASADGTGVVADEEDTLLSGLVAGSASVVDILQPQRRRVCIAHPAPYLESDAGRAAAAATSPPPSKVMELDSGQSYPRRTAFRQIMQRYCSRDVPGTIVQCTSGVPFDIVFYMHHELVARVVYVSPDVRVFKVIYRNREYALADAASAVAADYEVATCTKPSQLHLRSHPLRAFDVACNGKWLSMWKARNADLIPPGGSMIATATSTGSVGGRRKVTQTGVPLSQLGVKPLVAPFPVHFRRHPKFTATVVRVSFAVNKGLRRVHMHVRLPNGDELTLKQAYAMFQRQFSELHVVRSRAKHSDDASTSDTILRSFVCTNQDGIVIGLDQARWQDLLLATPDARADVHEE